MKKENAFVFLLLTLLSIMLQSCSFMSNMDQNPYVREAFKYDFENYFGVEYPY